MNLVVISGRLGQDPELRHTQGNKAVANFSLAVQSGTGDNKITHWFPVVVWGDLAEKVNQELKKGTFTTITGRLQNREWVNKEGGKVKSTEIVASSVGFPEFFKSKSEEKRVNTQTGEQPYTPEDEDIPF